LGDAGQHGGEGDKAHDAQNRHERRAPTPQGALPGAQDVFQAHGEPDVPTVSRVRQRDGALGPLHRLPEQRFVARVTTDDTVQPLGNLVGREMRFGGDRESAATGGHGRAYLFIIIPRPPNICMCIWPIWSCIDLF
jgi:hypothetical protein